ncbi:MAG: FtsW/RodA/SpoVE family cell cycle protein [Opitutales bacterium]
MPAVSSPTARPRLLPVNGSAVLVATGAALLVVFGLVALYSVAQGLELQQARQGEAGGAALRLLIKQVVWLVFGLGVATTLALVPLPALRKLAWPAYFAALVGLVLVLFIGREVNGAQRWIAFGPMTFQVAEGAKFALILVMAHYLASCQRQRHAFLKGYLYPLIITGSVAGLIIIQPDFGTAFLCGLVGFSLLFLAGARWLYLIPTALAALAGFSVMVYLDPVRLRRVTAFLDVEANKTDGAYQLWQGILAFASGGVSGVGLGNGRQQLAYLPEAHTDFIFSIIGEEMGLLATGSILALFLGLFLIGVWQLRRAPDYFQLLLVMGALLLITYQALINIGVVTGCLPTKGMSLPFISYGGSNLLLMCALTGILVNAFSRWEKPHSRRPREL